MGRGAFRAVYSDLFDDQDFRHLTPKARQTLLTARQNRDAGQAAIYRYDPELMQIRTGLSAKDLDAAMAELSRENWVYCDGIVIWVRNGLRHEPFFDLKHAKQRMGVVRVVESLPLSSVVVAFCDYYGFTEQADGIRKAMERVSRPSRKSLGSPSEGFPMGLDTPSCITSPDAGEGIETPSKGSGDSSENAETPTQPIDYSPPTYPYSPPVQEPRTKNLKPHMWDSASIEGGFQRFWEAFPKARRQNKADARKAWGVLKPDAALTEKILAALEAQKRVPDLAREDFRYFPHAHRWLAKRRWEDELPAAAEPTSPRRVNDAWQGKTEAREVTL